MNEQFFFLFFIFKIILQFNSFNVIHILLFLLILKSLPLSFMMPHFLNELFGFFLFLDLWANHEEIHDQEHAANQEEKGHAAFGLRLK